MRIPVIIVGNDRIGQLFIEAVSAAQPVSLVVTSTLKEHGALSKLICCVRMAYFDLCHAAELQLESADLLEQLCCRLAGMNSER